MNRFSRKISLVVFAATLSASAALAQSPTIEGEVKKIDESAAKITLKHGPAKSLGMDEQMTMVYRVKDPAMLDQVKEGDNIRFDADRIGGQFTVIRMEQAK